MIPLPNPPVFATVLPSGDTTTCVTGSFRVAKCLQRLPDFTSHRLRESDIPPLTSALLSGEKASERMVPSIFQWCISARVDARYNRIPRKSAAASTVLSGEKTRTGSGPIVLISCCNSVPVFISQSRILPSPLAVARSLPFGVNAMAETFSSGLPQAQMRVILPV